MGLKQCRVLCSLLFPLLNGCFNIALPPDVAVGIQERRYEPQRLKKASVMIFLPLAGWLHNIYHRITSFKNNVWGIVNTKHPARK